MIKINVITKNINWFRYIKNPNNYLDRKIDKLNLKSKIFIKKFNILIKNLERKIKQQTYYRFHFKQKRN